MRSAGGIVLFLAALSMLGSIGCATNAPAPAAAAQSPAPVARDVPRLKVVMDCGGCEVKPEVKGWIAQAYAEEASYNGAKILQDQEATLTVTQWTLRSDSSRILFGALAGKDEIKAVLAFRERRIQLGEYFVNAVSGPQNLARKMGQTAFHQLAR